ncbi:MAG: hypothetical protein J6Q94_07245 [Clostridia bacterium]|nr:hypothetical protein [Clostridia bacterium]
MKNSEVFEKTCTKEKKCKVPIIIIVAVLLTLCLTATGIFFCYKAESNANSYANYEDAFNNIENEDTEQKKAEALYYAIVSNSSLRKKEKEELSNYIQYFKDNKYIDYNHVFEKLKTFKITWNNPFLLKEGISATYNADNSITFATNEYRQESLTHEIFHCIEKENMPEGYGWFSEGFTSLLNYEYFDKKGDGWSTKANIIRCLCELIDPDILFKVSATGEPNYLIDALNKKGIDGKKIKELFDLCEKYKVVEFDVDANLQEMLTKIASCFVEMYNTIHDTPDYVRNSFYYSILRILEETYDYYDYYYLNKLKVNDSPETKYNKTQDELSTMIEKSLIAHY